MAEAVDIELPKFSWLCPPKIEISKSNLRSILDDDDFETNFVTVSNFLLSKSFEKKKLHLIELKSFPIFQSCIGVKVDMNKYH